MNDQNGFLPVLVQQKARSLGVEGGKWLDQIKDILNDLEQRWGIRYRKTLEGGSEALVAEVVCRDGSTAILKLGMPQMEGNAVIEQEIEALRIANGNGYVRLLNEDTSQRALLLELLGKPLNLLGYSPAEEMEIICPTLRKTWKPVQGPHNLQSYNDLMEWFKQFIPELWNELGNPCPKNIIDLSLNHLESRLTNSDFNKGVLVHGDAHSGNILQHPAEPQPSFKLIDPDGVLAEPSYDLGVLMREWPEDLLEDPLEKGKNRCALLAHLTGEDPEGIWEWGYIQCVSTGLLLIKTGQEPLGNQMLGIAAAWLEESSKEVDL